MSYSYTSFQQALALWMAIPNSNIASPNFVAALPSIVDYAEQRCYRELDLLNATTAAAPIPTVPAQRTLSFAGTTPQILILENATLLLEDGSRQPIVPTSKEWLDMVYGGPMIGRPVYFGMLDDTTIVLGPWPDDEYDVEFLGKYRPVPLYAAAPGDGTQETFLSANLPDLFFAAAMVSAAGYQKNFGSQSDDPKMAQSWETQFQTLLPSAKGEEMRRKFHGWQAATSEMQPPPTPQPAPGG